MDRRQRIIAGLELSTDDDLLEAVDTLLNAYLSGEDDHLLQRVEEAVENSKQSLPETAAEPSHRTDPTVRTDHETGADFQFNTQPSGMLGPGDRCGPFTIESELGEGGMGTVYKAIRSDDLDLKVALKTLTGLRPD